MKMDRLLLLIVQIPLALSLAGHLSWWGYYWPTLLHQFQLQAFAAGIVLVAVTGLKRARMPLIAAGMLALSGLLAMAPALPLQNTKIPAGESLKAINYNVYSRNPDQAGVASLIRAENPDVVALIEANALWSDTASGLKDLLPHQHLIDEPGNFGMMLLSKHPLLQVQEVADIKINTRMLLADIDTPAGPTRFVLVHTFPPPHGHEVMQHWDVQIGALAAAVSLSPYPIVLLGDFNAVPWSPPMVKLALTSELSAGNLIPTWRPSGITPLAIPIDHILAANGAYVKDMRIGSWQQSDHRPMIATLIIKDTK